jgi:hypothetical protein
MRDRKNIFQLAALLACVLVYCAAIVTAQQQPPAQASPAQVNPVQLPIVPVIVEYDYASQYFRQWINDHPQYSMITAVVGEGASPVYQIIFTEKESKREIYYSNSEAKVKTLTLAGKEAHRANISLKVMETAGTVPTYEFTFRNQQKQPVIWRFIPASRPSEKGAGLTPMAAASGLRLLYRNLGTNAGEGTAVQIGDKVSEAEPWPEVSAPPYFISYRGSFAEGMDMGSLLAGTESWRVDSVLGELREGTQWTEVGSGGRKRQLKITARRGDEMTVSVSDAQEFAPAALDLNVHTTAQGLALRSLVLTRGARTMRMTFTPELPLSVSAAADGKTEVGFQVEQGKRKKTAEGSVFIEKQGNTMRLRWQTKSPEWAKANVLNSTITTNGSNYTVEVTSAAKPSK